MDENARVGLDISATCPDGDLTGDKDVFFQEPCNDSNHFLLLNTSLYLAEHAVIVKLDCYLDNKCMMVQ